MYRHSIIFLVFLLLSGCSGFNSTSNSAYGRYLDCQHDALKNFLSQDKSCYEKKSFFEQSTCYSSIYKTISSQSCMKAASISFNSISEMYKLLAYVDDPSNPQKYSSAKRNEIFGKINSLIRQEESVVRDIMFQDLDRRKAAYYESRVQYYESLAQSNIYNSLAILGAQQQYNSRSTNDSSFRTYILNGRAINCMTTGNLTSCQ